MESWLVPLSIIQRLRRSLVKLSGLWPNKNIRLSMDCNSFHMASDQSCISILLCYATMQLLLQNAHRQQNLTTNNRGRQPFSRSYHLVGTLVLHTICRTLHSQIRARRNAQRNAAVTRQHVNHSNNKLSHHLVGTMTSHWRPLYDTELSKLTILTKS